MLMLHPALLIGLGLVSIPVILHLIMRAKPKRLIFPALRLIQQSRRQNVRRLQIRHLWLLLLRMLVIALIVLALSRPSLPAANYSLVWYEWAILLATVGIGIASYFGILSWWQRRNWPRNTFLTRRTMLRGVVGFMLTLLLLLGVGWPYAHRVAAEIKDPAPKLAENAPVAAVFLFDNSPSMGYRQGNQNRLQSAQQIARDHLGRLPSGSKVAVTNLQETAPPPFSLDLQAARSRVDVQEIRLGVLTTNERIRNVLTAQDDDRRRVTAEQTSVPEDKRQDRYVREIYLFTDLARSAWRDDASSFVRDELERLKFVSLYIIDVGETAPANVGITTVKLSRDTVPIGGTVKIDTGLSAIGNVKPEQTVELYLSEGGKLVKRGQQTISVERGVERSVTFDLPPLTARLQQGEVRIAGSDPLSIDDVGYFTVRTLPQLKILVVAESSDASYIWRSMLDYLASEKITDYRTEFLPAAKLKDVDLTSFDVVYLINNSSPDDAVWNRLRAFVDAGGGLGVFLGANNAAGTAKRGGELINPVAYNTNGAQAVLPAELKASLPHSPPQTIDFRNTQHPLLKRLEDLGGILAELGVLEVNRFWKVETREDAIVVAKYDGAQGLPALVERRIGRGRVMLMTTAVDKNGDDAWNEWVGTGWYMIFADQLSQYLSQQGSVRCNMLAGDEVTLPIDRDRKLKKVVVRMPDMKQRPQEIPSESSNLVLRNLTSIGSYQIDSAEGEVDYHMGFSLNLPAAESNLKRLEPKELDGILGEGRYSISRDPTSLERSIHSSRMGQEMYSFIIALLVVIFATEQFTATWFYRTDEA